MKLILAFLLLICLSCSQITPDQIKQKQLWYKNQLVDHFDPRNNDTYDQRYWLIDQFYNPEKGPVIIYICGEYTCPGLPEDRLWPAYIAQMYEGLILVLEHRYYGASQPFGEESLTLENLKLLTVEQALEDLAYFINDVKTSGMHGVKQNSPFMTIGGSYPGAMSAWFRYKYPHLTVGALASSAVINAFVDFPQFDNQIKNSAKLSSDKCAQQIHDLNVYVQDKIYDPVTSQNYKSFFNATHVENGQFMFYYADIFVEKIQYGERTWLCEELAKGTTEENAVWVIKLVNQEGISPNSYSSYYLKNTTYNIDDSSRQWTYQTCTQLGWFQTPSSPQDEACRSKYVTLDMYSGLCSQSFEGNKFDPTTDQINIEFGGVDLQAFNLILTNGVEDPWKWAGLITPSTDKQMEVREIDCTDCAHCVDLYTPKDSDSKELKDARAMEIDEISRWIHEYNEANGYDFNDEPVNYNLQHIMNVLE